MGDRVLRSANLQMNELKNYYENTLRCNIIGVHSGKWIILWKTKKTKTMHKIRDTVDALWPLKSEDDWDSRDVFLTRIGYEKSEELSAEEQEAGSIKRLPGPVR